MLPVHAYTDRQHTEPNLELLNDTADARQIRQIFVSRLKPIGLMEDEGGQNRVRPIYSAVSSSS